LLKSGAINAAATGLRFNLPLQSPLSYNLAGTLREATIDAATRLDPETKTHLVLQLDEVRLLGLEMLNADNPGLALGTINLAADGKGRTIKVTTLTAQGGDLEVSAEGTVLIGRTSATSRIRLTLQVRPGSNADPSITSLLTLAGQPDAEGRYTLQLTGTLAKPNLKSGG
jgi:type II secretion system protein N